MRLQKRALLSPSRGTFPSPREEPEAFSSSEATALKAAGRRNQPNEGDTTFVSFSFFIVLMALPVVSVLFMSLRYMCERQSSRRERRERRERARAALRTHFVLASSSLPETSAANGDRRREEGAGGSDALVAFFAANDTSNNNARRGVVDASTIDRLADAVIAGANPGYRRRRSSRRRRRIEENSIASYRAEAVRRDLRRAFRTGDFSNYDRNVLHRVLQEQLPGNGAMTESDDDEETTTNFRISAENGDTLFVADEPGPASRKTLQSLPSCKIGDKNWQLFIAGRARDDLQNLTTCALCLEDLKNFQPNQHQVIVLECEHVFCKSCVIPWFQLRASCPTCRRVVFAYSKEDRESVFSPPPLPEEVPSVVVAKEEKDAPRERDVEAAVPA